jgi:uracil phosphoribosyltransferase
MVTNLSNQVTIVSSWLRQLRDINIQTDRLKFRNNIKRIGEIIGYEISKTLTFTKEKIQTPITTTDCFDLKEQPVLFTILRAGIPLYDGLLSVFDNADSGFVASFRQHTEDGNFNINQQYLSSPSIQGKDIIVCDTMLASGSSFIEAINQITKQETPKSIHIVAVIASPQGVERLKQEYPEAHIWVASIDEDLNNKGYIVPGLGDAGDLCYGHKL